MITSSCYAALHNISQIKRHFIKELGDKLFAANNKKQYTAGKLNFIKFSELKDWDIKLLFAPLPSSEQALLDKVEYMLLCKHGDLASVIRMLYSFRFGVKCGLKNRDYEDRYEYIEKDGNGIYSQRNLPKAHFRWNHDTRYILTEQSVQAITQFIDEILKS